MRAVPRGDGGSAPRKGVMHPLVAEIRRIIEDEGERMYLIELEAGIGQGSFARWRHDIPRVDKLEAVLRVLGYRLRIEKE